MVVAAAQAVKRTAQGAAAPLPIGISINTGKATTEYVMRRDYRDYWIIEPGWVK